MDTSANRKAMPKADFDKWPKVEEVAATIVFLASPDNKGRARHRTGVRQELTAIGTSSSGGRRQALHVVGATTLRPERTVGPIVVLLDLAEIVEIVHHQRVRLRDGFFSDVCRAS